MNDLRACLIAQDDDPVGHPSASVECRGCYGNDGCGWSGRSGDLKNACCPVCYGGYIADAPARGDKSLKYLGEHLPAYFDKVTKRLHTGAREYGDGSFDRETADLIDEIQQELEDVAGWSAIAWTKLEMLRRRVGK